MHDRNTDNRSNSSHFTRHDIEHVTHITQSSDMVADVAEELITVIKHTPHSVLAQFIVITSHHYPFSPSVINICFSADTAGVCSALATNYMANHCEGIHHYHCSKSPILCNLCRWTPQKWPKSILFFFSFLHLSETVLKHTVLESVSSDLTEDTDTSFNFFPNDLFFFPFFFPN